MNVPKLRFSEFHDEWKENKLNDIAKITMGQSPNSENYTNDSNDTLLIQGNADLNNGKVVPRLYTKQITKTCDKEDIIMTVRAPVGDIAISDYNACIGRGVCSIKSSKFIYHYLDYLKIKGFWKKISKGSTIDSITSDDIKSLVIKIPSKNEEEKIIKTIDLLNKKIELQSKKIEDLKLFKKGLHNRLFNEIDGNDYLLFDVVLFENGKGHENIIDDNGEYVLINSKFISTEGNVIKKCSKQLTPLFKNDIAMVMSDLPNGKALAKCYYIDENDKYSLNQRICKIRIKDDRIVNPKYLFYFLNRNPYYLKFDDGVNQTNLKKEDILNIDLVVPPIKEQEKTSKVLTIIDRIIEKENNKFYKLTDLKKGLMQSMFV